MNYASEVRKEARKADAGKAVLYNAIADELENGATIEECNRMVEWVTAFLNADEKTRKQIGELIANDPDRQREV